AAVFGQARADRAADEAHELGLLGEQVYVAAGRAAAGLRRGGAFHHLDLLGVEGVAGVAGEVADAVDEDVVARAEAAQGEVVAAGPAAAFARGHRDARDVAQHVAQARRGLLLHHFPGDDADRLRRVLDLAQAAVERVDPLALAGDDDRGAVGHVVAALAAEFRRRLGEILRLRRAAAEHERRAGQRDRGPAIGPDALGVLEPIPHRIPLRLASRSHLHRG